MCNNELRTPDRGPFCVTLRASPEIQSAGNNTTAGEDEQFAADPAVRPQPDIPSALDFAAQTYGAVSALIGIVGSSRTWFFQPLGQGLGSSKDFLAGVRDQLRDYLPDEVVR